MTKSDEGRTFAYGINDCLHGAWALNGSTWTCQLCGCMVASGNDEQSAKLVLTNEQLAEWAKTFDAHTVVRNWLDRHPRDPQSAHWSSWAASNFLADPEIAQHLAQVRPQPTTRRDSSQPSELDEFFSELFDRTDEIQGSPLTLGPNSEVWVFTEGQVKAWLQDAIEAWRIDDYVTSDAEDES